MFPIGVTLAAAREARGLDLRAAERLTCMRARYLTALEADRFDDLPGRTYARAFLRTYASALGLDADRIVAEFDEQVPEPVEPVERPAPRRRPPIATWRAAAPLAFAAAIAIVAWAAWTGGRPTHVPTAAPSFAAPPPATQPHRATAAPATARKPPASRVLVVQAAGPCWVQARRAGPGGAVLVERTLAAGDTLHLRGARVWLRLGAPWNVVVRRGSHVVRLAATSQPVNVVA